VVAAAQGNRQDSTDGRIAPPFPSPLLARKQLRGASIAGTMTRFGISVRHPVFGMSGAIVYNPGVRSADISTYRPKAYLAARRNDVERRRRAAADARRIARFLSDQYGARVYGIGSLFEPERDFTWRSDIDLVVENLPDEQFFAICAEAQQLTDFPLDIVPLEDAREHFREAVRTRGVGL
jgi:predicted nucleotidyltransferase